MTDGKVAAQATRIYRYLVKLEHLPTSSYSEAKRAEQGASHRAKIEEAIASIEQSAHANAGKITSIIRAEIDQKRINFIASNVRPCLDLPRNWVVKNHELEHIQA